MRGLTALVLALAVGGCAQILGLKPGHVADGGVPDDAAADGAAPDGAAPDGAAPDGAAPDGAAPDGAVSCISQCESTTPCGACPTNPMVDVLDFKVDAAEVTVRDYGAWLAVNPGLGVFASLNMCNWVANDFTPANWAAQTAGDLDLPVTGVNWCQAAGYCLWAKKYLCGKMGLGALNGGAVDFDKYNQLGTGGSQWYAACTGNNAAQQYPNPAAGDAGVCNVESSGTRKHVITSQCTGGFTGLFDMSGNVAEWEYCCDGILGRADQCRIRGGAYDSAVTDARCGTNSAAVRETQSPRIGFRCCAKQ
jgi:formylglycine-generating enzyme required for sulfatase activity